MDIKSPELLERLQVEVEEEMDEQVLQWGYQRHEDGTGTPLFKRLAGQYKKLVDEEADKGESKWAHILLEEIYEALESVGLRDLDQELKEAAAVIQSWRRDIATR